MSERICIHDVTESVPCPACDAMDHNKSELVLAHAEIERLRKILWRSLSLLETNLHYTARNEINDARAALKQERERE